jgi:EAL domain-containing protein (putative c-di-GMP-specific phosphodiesterase class I)
MFDESGVLLPAGEFLPIAEKMGLIRSIDCFALDAAMTEMRASSDVRLSVNISSLSTTDPSWLRALTAQVKGQENIG